MESENNNSRITLYNLHYAEFVCTYIMDTMPMSIHLVMAVEN